MTSEGVHHVEFSKNNSTCQRHLSIWVIVSAGRMKLFVRKTRCLLVSTSA